MTADYMNCTICFNEKTTPLLFRIITGTCIYTYDRSFKKYFSYDPFRMPCMSLCSIFKTNQSIRILGIRVTSFI